jgi:hypothetical protein
MLDGGMRANPKGLRKEIGAAPGGGSAAPYGSRRGKIETTGLSRYT